MKRKAVETVEKRKSARRDPLAIIIVGYTAAAIVASISTGAVTAWWVGLLVYAVATLELLVFLVALDLIGGCHGV